MARSRSSDYPQPDKALELLEELQRRGFPSPINTPIQSKHFGPGSFSHLALDVGGDIKAGAAVAIISSLVGLPTALLMEYINTLYPDQDRYRGAFNTYKVALELLFNHEQELSSIRKDRRK